MAIDSAKLGNEIWLEIRRDRVIRFRSKAFADEVRAWWADVEAPRPGPEHPYATGEYAESIHVERRRDRFGLPHYWVGTRHANANFIEFGTGPDRPGSNSSFGPNTPTPEMAPAAKTATHFEGPTERRRELL